MFNKLLKLNTDVVSRFQFPVFFIPLFLSILAVYGYSEVIGNVLHSFNGRMLGISTLENVDASFRVKFFYRSIYLMAGVFFIFNTLFNFLLKKKPSFVYVLEPAGYISLLGIFSFLFLITLGEGLSVIYFSVLILASLSLLGLIIGVTGKPMPGISSVSLFVWILWLSIILFLLFDYLSKWIIPGTAFHFNISVSCIALLLALVLFIRNPDEVRFRAWVYVLSPLTFIPLMIFSSAEFAMICNQRNINIVGSLGVFIFLIILMLFWVYLKYRKWSKNGEIANNVSLKKYIPVFLVGIIAIVVWEPLRSMNTEMFEIANPANAMMRIFSFKEIPLFSFLNSHLISEVVTGFLYFLFNGYDGSVAFKIYDFIYFALIGLVIYSFISRITGNYIIALFFCLFIPFTEELAGESFAYSLILLFCILKFYKKQDRKTWFLFWIVLFLLMLFRPDVSFAMFFALFFLVFSLPGFFSFISVKRGLITMSVIAVPILLVFTIVVYMRDIPLLQNLNQAFMYFTASQSHGSLVVVTALNRTSIAQYIIIPFVLAILLVFILYRRKKIFSENPMLFAGMVFMIVFYFTNFQRGLLRHGFNEGHDNFLASFSFLILSLTPYVVFNIKKIYQHILFLFFSFLFIWQIGFPEPTGSLSLFELLSRNKSNKFYVPANQSRINRVKENNNSLLGEINVFKDFAAKNMSENQTFLDLSNSPMLYYFSQKRVPSYFNQGIQNVVTDRLQLYMLSDIQKFDIPFCVISNVPATWFDATDDVPNTLRYYRISEYVFSRYHPWAIVGGHTVWLRNDLNNSLGSYSPDTITGGVFTYEIKKLPYVWAQYEQDHKLKTFKKFSEKELTIHGENYTAFIDSTVISANGNYIDVNVTCKIPGEQNYILDFGKDWEIYGQFGFVIINKNASENYRIRVSTMYRWFDRKINFVRIRPKDNSGGVNVNSLTITEAD